MPVTTLTELSEDDLLAMLGKELLGPGIGFGPEDPGRYRRFAEHWIEERADKIRVAICHDESVQAVFAKDLQDRFNDWAVLADALTTLAGRPPLTLLAVVLLRRGYEAVCGH
ncbi:MAG TPA: hypothetical protein VGL78_13245 [Solirubrobacteraceae bacterium]|jgi:hypothetical protein